MWCFHDNTVAAHHYTPAHWGAPGSKFTSLSHGGGIPQYSFWQNWIKTEIETVLCLYSCTRVLVQLIHCIDKADLVNRVYTYITLNYSLSRLGSSNKSSVISCNILSKPRAWYIILCVWRRDRDMLAHWGSEQQEEQRYQQTYHTYLASRGNCIHAT